MQEICSIKYGMVFDLLDHCVTANGMNRNAQLFSTLIERVKLKAPKEAIATSYVMKVKVDCCQETKRVFFVY